MAAALSLAASTLVTETTCLSKSFREEDIEKVRGMLGRTPMGTWMIHSYCDSNRTHPQVLKVHPLMRRKKRGDLTPMPTLYWLCCPHYQYWISRLEGEGYIEKVNSLLENNESMAQAFHNNNKRYIDQRWDLLSESERKFVAERSTVQDRLLRSGIGGSANLRRIRCLHENFAHFLATEDNVVGEYISSLGLIPPCPTCTEAAATEKNHNS
ncbi:hypothetical protein AAMO2058_000984200 [Amorphochlora amoebiformis]